MTNCTAKKARLNIADPVFKDGYAYMVADDGSYLLLDHTDKNMEVARKDLKCPCTVERVGVLYRLTPSLSVVRENLSKLKGTHEKK